MAWILKKSVAIGKFHRSSEIQYHDPVGDLPDNREIVADENHRKPVLCAQILQKRQNPGLYREVECRNCFVPDNQPWRRDHGARDANTLVLSATRFMRETICQFSREADPFHHFRDEAFSLGRREFGPVRPERFGDGGRHRHAWIETGKRVLKDDLKVLAVSFQGVCLEPGKFMAEPGNASAPGCNQLQDRPCQSRLSAAPSMPAKARGTYLCSLTANRHAG